MSKQELRLHRCCFTGHRPNKMNLGQKAMDEAIASRYVTMQKKHTRKSNNLKKFNNIKHLY